MTLVSDRAGRIQLDTKVRAFSIVSDFWSQARTSTDEVLSSGVAWIYSPLQLRAIVEDETGTVLPVEEVTFWVWPLEYPRGQRPLPPWEFMWLSARVGRGRPFKADAEGLLRGTTPRLRAVGVTALYMGRRSALVEVAPPPAQEPFIPVVDVRLRLREMPSISGVVRDRSGRPIDNARVVVSVKREVRPEDVDRSRLLPPDVASSLIVHRDGSGTVSLDTYAITDGQGRYRIALPQEGRAIIEVLSAAHLASRAEVPSIAAETVRDFELQTAADCPRVRLVWRGQPLAEQDVIIGDVTDLRTQMGHTATVDADGFLSGQWLQYGREYAIVATLDQDMEVEDGVRRIQRFFHWQEQSEIDLRALHGHLDTFKNTLR